MKKFCISLLIYLTVFLFFGGMAYAEFWSSKTSNKYHHPNCKWAQTIKPSNLLKFSTPEAAIQAGFMACRVCKPPAASKAEVDATYQAVMELLKKSEADKPKDKR
jgi:methylphosphotriester-DNA--protein-cysteine methyltransferase